MALPVPDKTWQFNVNQAIPAQANALTTNRRVMRTMKNTLIGFGSNPWTVQGSSNSSAAAMDSVDRWGSDTDLVANIAGSAHSWIVLRQTGVSSTFELCIDLNSNTPQNSYCERYISSVGFTGGTTLNRPTATDEILLPASQTGWGIVTTNTSWVIHGMQSTDGQATYMFLMTANTVQAMLGFGRIKNPVSGLTNPCYAFWETETPFNSATVSESADSSFFSVSLVKGAGATPTGMTMFMTTEAAENSILTELFVVPNDFNGEYPIFPIGLASNTVSNRGRHGQVFDMWIGLSTLLTGDTYPNDTSRQFAHFGTYILPWNGSVMVTA